ncbi:MAG TPA: FecR domain-containing protein [Gemmataceae bacterium]|nr:FecR domain-containing protein [Gemmataceae bacterium]
MSEPLESQIEDYLSGQIDEPRLRDLETRLRDDPEARRVFVRYARLHTDLHFELRAREASERVLGAIARDPDTDLAPPITPPPAPPARSARRRVLALAAVAAGLLGAVVLGWWATRPKPEVAWLVNAQDCTWAGGEPPTELRPGKVLTIDRGLAEFRFECGARVILEGPARLEVLSGSGARLHSGKLAARAPAGASGFEVLSPHGKVVDFGTEFGVAVSDAGVTDVRVFEGRVEVFPAGGGPTAAVSLTGDQSARIAAGTVTILPEPAPAHFVRALVLVPRTLRLAFDRPAEGGIQDVDGLLTGLTHRLPGTGSKLPGRDPNLRFDIARGQLELTTTDSDLNTQYQLERGEYLGLRLSDVGFTGSENFEVSATFPAIPALDGIGQLGLYAGSRSDRVIRGGVLIRRFEVGQYTQFLVNNPDGNDTGFRSMGVLANGTDLRVTLRRVNGKFSLTVEKLTDGFVSTLTPIRHPHFLDGERDLYVGLFAANTQSPNSRTLVVKELQVTVWTVNPGPAR